MLVQLGTVLAGSAPACLGRPVLAPPLRAHRRPAAAASGRTCSASLIQLHRWAASQKGQLHAFGAGRRAIGFRGCCSRSQIWQGPHRVHGSLTSFALVTVQQPQAEGGVCSDQT